MDPTVYTILRQASLDPARPTLERTRNRLLLLTSDIARAARWGVPPAR